MTESKAHEAALKLVNEIALVDLDMAAKIKPSIDMFVESIENTLSNNELFNDLTEFFKLTDDNAKKQWLIQHKEIASKINEIFDSMSNDPKPINEVKELKDGKPTSDIPIQPDKKVVETEISAIQIPEDGFKDDKITAPLQIDGDDKRLMGKEPNDKTSIDPNKVPKVIDGNEGQAEEVKIPKNNQSTTIGTVKSIYQNAVKESIKRVLKPNKLIKEDVAEKYAKFLDQKQFDDALTSIENDLGQKTQFTRIRTFAMALYREFQDEFENYNEALKVAQEWYKYQGRSNRLARKTTPSNIYVEMRGDPNGFNVNLYLVKKDDELTNNDTELAADLYETYTNEYSDDKVDLWKKIGSTDSGNKIWKMTIPFPRERKTAIPISRIKNNIVDFIHSDNTYKSLYQPTTKIPGWIFDYVNVTTESLNEDKNAFDKNQVQDLAQEFVEDILSMGDNPDDMTVYDFIDWAWDGNVPQEDIRYISTMFNWAKNGSTKEIDIKESLSEDIKAILFDIFQSIFDEYLKFESPDEEVDWEDINQYIKNEFIEHFEDFYIPKDVVVNITSLDVEDIEKYVDEFLANQQEILEM